MLSTNEITSFITDTWELAIAVFGSAIGLASGVIGLVITVAQARTIHKSRKPFPWLNLSAITVAFLLPGACFAWHELQKELRASRSESSQLKQELAVARATINVSRNTTLSKGPQSPSIHGSGNIVSNNATIGDNSPIALGGRNNSITYVTDQSKLPNTHSRKK